jgi:hypothetical protein
VWSPLGDDELVQFVVGTPEVTAWTIDGAPFQLSHPCYCIDAAGNQVDWPLIETLDRPLEVKNYKRIA